MNRRIKSLLSKVNFVLELNPQITKQTSKQCLRLIPYPHKAVLLLCADLELAWAWRYAKVNGDSKERARKLAQEARRNIDKIIHLCEAYKIPITWATVGHLLLEKCERTFTWI